MEFGENGIVAVQDIDTVMLAADYTVPTTKIKRVALGSFVAALAACFFVSAIGVFVIIGANLIAGLLGISTSNLLTEHGFWSGVTMATFSSAMNWYFGYLTVPAAWLALGFSIGRFPKRGITRPAPYYRWGAIWGALLVGATTTIGVAVMSQSSFGMTSAEYASGVLGAGMMGALIGALSGMLCGGIFRGIVRPTEQVRKIALDVF
jgi:hypothetical protein